MDTPTVLGLGLSNLRIFWYFIYLWGFGIVNFISFWVGLFRGIDGTDYVAEFEAAQGEWYQKIISDFLA